MEKNNLECTTLHTSLLHHDLLLGGEKFLVAPLVGMMAALVLQAQSWGGAIMALALFVLVLPLIRLTANSDPQMSQLVLRELKMGNKLYYADATPHSYLKTAPRYNVRAKS